MHRSNVTPKKLTIVKFILVVISCQGSPPKCSVVYLKVPISCRFFDAMLLFIRSRNSDHASQSESYLNQTSEALAIISYRHPLPKVVLKT